MVVLNNNNLNQQHDNPIIRSSLISLKKSLGSTYKKVTLVNISQKEHLQMVFSALFDPLFDVEGTSEHSNFLYADPPKEMTTILGHLSLALLNNTPLLIIQSKKPTRTELPTFVMLCNVVSFMDEIDVASACTFVLRLYDGDLRFVCDSSTEYQSWMAAFKVAFHLLSLDKNDAALTTTNPVALSSSSQLQMQQQLPGNNVSRFKKSFNILMNRIGAASQQHQQLWTYHQQQYGQPSPPHSQSQHSSSDENHGDKMILASPIQSNASPLETPGSEFPTLSRITSSTTTNNSSNSANNQQQQNLPQSSGNNNSNYQQETRMVSSSASTFHPSKYTSPPIATYSPIPPSTYSIQSNNGKHRHSTQTTLYTEDFKPKLSLDKLEIIPGPTDNISVPPISATTNLINSDYFNTMHSTDLKGIIQPKKMEWNEELQQWVQVGGLH